MRRLSPTLVLLFLVASLVLFCQPRTAKAYTPEHPVVKEMVNRAVTFIDKRAGGGMTQRLGGQCLVGLTIFKHTHNPEHRLVKAAVARCQQTADKGPTRMETIYDIGIALIFLGEVGPELYRAEIEIILNMMLKMQKSAGGFGYLQGPHASTGDTSMTQYAVLGIWTADRQKIDVPNDAIERVCGWLLRTQSIDGGWNYQGEDPGSFTRIQQGKPTLSLSAAGLSSVYVCADLLGMIDKDQRASQLPPAIRLVLTEEEKAKMRDRTGVPAAAVKRAASDGNKWFGQNFNIKADSLYQHYYMYALERYKSFQELVEKTKDEEPEWYNQGVEMLKETQSAQGAWSSCEGGPVIDSCFGVLFLIRSTKKSIRRIVYEQGRLTGGRGLDSDLSTARVDSRGKVVTVDATKAVADLIKMLDDPKTPQGEIQDVPEKLTLSKDPQKRSGELARLRRMALNGSFKARLLAVETISTVRDLDSVPALIFALSDPDYRVARQARNALRFMSRKTHGFGMPDSPGGEKYKVAVYKAAQDKWTDWYLSVRPDGELIE
jgi:hypothetical protein